MHKLQIFLEKEDPFMSLGGLIKVGETKSERLAYMVQRCALLFTQLTISFLFGGNSSVQ